MGWSWRFCISIRLPDDSADPWITPGVLSVCTVESMAGQRVNAYTLKQNNCFEEKQVLKINHTLAELPTNVLGVGAPGTHKIK